ncbi:hypothetical protein SASPL_144907 [Salvia splendens]|uniref:Uncharacterized protein n=1 Tax=Salvia splendens TaxID=180675 RepID=A0A8X8WHF8_SALSN|nr:hypothetical protein SASPL_144907 [Salvia splendens]
MVVDRRQTSRTDCQRRQELLEQPHFKATAASAQRKSHHREQHRKASSSDLLQLTPTGLVHQTNRFRENSNEQRSNEAVFIGSAGRSGRVHAMVGRLARDVGKWGKNPFMFSDNNVASLPEPGIGNLGGADEDGLTYDAEILFGG